MSEGRWSDLAPRIASAVVMVVVGGAGILAGGMWFKLLIAASCGAMIWELVRMLTPAQGSAALQLGALTAVTQVVAWLMPPVALLPIALAVIPVGMSILKSRKWAFAGFALWIALAGIGFVWLRGSLGLTWVAWLICIVVVTDVAGYFAGKAIGGPKFWPAISPKKTWSGTAAGWVGALIVGALFATQMGAGLGLCVVSVLASMASQAGDVLESALKRRTGTKDSSNLIPGHGGFLDRFDGMMGAMALVLVLSLFYSPGV
ncbi:phosphatidate cytidylyltransferase [Rhodobacteraceae bacterium M382]|nr:phosphatidate cytidylyltransferase [Rhodobacteraceae bacterium M382]